MCFDFLVRKILLYISVVFNDITSAIAITSYFLYEGRRYKDSFKDLPEINLVESFIYDEPKLVACF